MGVITCDRRDCDGIMCDYRSTQYGDLCWRCFDELCAANIPPDQIQVFMNTPSMAAQISYKPIYEQIFRHRDDPDLW